MKILVIAEIHDGILAEDQTNKTICAATELSTVDVLCASSNCDEAAKKFRASIKLTL